MKNELQGQNHAEGPVVATRRGLKIYYTRKTSGQASAPGMEIQKLPCLLKMTANDILRKCHSPVGSRKKKRRDQNYLWKKVSLRNEECVEGSFNVI
jgi:hypothetical protein